MNQEKQLTIEEQIKIARQRRDAYVHRSYFLMLELIFLFGIPAVGAFFIGRHFDSTHGGQTYTLVALLCSFILSWFLVAFRIKGVLKQIKMLENKVKELTAKQNNQTK